MSQWPIDPLAAPPLAAAVGAYLWGVRRVAAARPDSGPHHPEPATGGAASAALSGARRESRRGAGWPRHRTLAYLSGVALLALAVSTPIERAAEERFAVHMAQHLVLSMAVAPLLLLGAPATLVLRAAHRRARRTLRRVATSRPVAALGHPLFAWGAFVAVLVGTHFSPLYQEALEDVAAHRLEHVLYLVSGLLFWLPVVGLDGLGHRLATPLRLAYVLLATPANTVTALAIYSAGRPLYPHYAEAAARAGSSALADQRAAAVVMWLGGDLILVATVAALVVVWAREDRVAAARADRRLDAAS